MRYRDVVRQAQRLWDALEESGWELARLTFERTYGHGGSRSAQDAAGLVSLTQWAADVGRFGKDTASVYRRTWERYGEDRLTDKKGKERTFGEHLFAVRHPDKLDMLDTPEGRSPARQRIVEQRETPKAVMKKATAAEKIAITEELLNDPEVVYDPGVRMIAMTLPEKPKPVVDPAARAAASAGLDAIKSAAASIAVPAWVPILEGAAKNLHFVVENDAAALEPVWDRVVKAVRTMAEDVAVYAMRHGLEGDDVYAMMREAK